MEALILEIGQLLDQTLKPDNNFISTVTEALEQLSLRPEFPFVLIAISTSGGENLGQKIAAATYLKNLIRRYVDSTKVSNEFKNQLVTALLRSEPAVLKVLIEAFRIIIVKEFVKENSWPELVPELRSVIQSSNFVSEDRNSQWNTINALTVLQTITKPFQYFLNPTVAKEPVPPQLEIVVKEILVPLLTLFHHLVEKALSAPNKIEMEVEKILLIICKCISFSVRSYMPADLVTLLPSFCLDIFRIVDSLSFDGTMTEDGYSLRLSTGKRSLQILCSLVTRHKKYSNKLMRNITCCVSKVVKQSPNISKLDFKSERVISLAFDVLSHVLRTGQGWRTVSPQFSSLLDSAIFPALVMNQKDVLEWEEDPDEYMSKNLPSDLKFMDGNFTARKSAINLLGFISMAKGPPTTTSSQSASTKRKKSEKNKGKVQPCSVGDLLVLPFLSKFPVPSGASVYETNNYYGVLMAYGCLQDFLRERNPLYTANLVRTRVLPVYSLFPCVPYLVASANWVLGELASCLPQEMSADVYGFLLKALIMPDMEDIPCYPVRASAAGAIAELLENDYLPPEWLPLLQVLVNKADTEDDNESSIFFQLLSTVVQIGSEGVSIHIPNIVPSLVEPILKHIPPIPEPWPQGVERAFGSLAVMAEIWEGSIPAETEEGELSEAWISGRAAIARAFLDLLQRAWLKPLQLLEEDISLLPPSSCIGDASKLLWFIARSVDESNAVSDLKISELLMVWAHIIADWHAWDELEDLLIFTCISEVVNLHKRCALKNFLVGNTPSPPAPPVQKVSIVEGIGAFTYGALSEYPPATWRACSCLSSLLHIPTFSFEEETVKQSLVIASSQAAFSRFIEIQSTPNSKWKPLMFLISSCFLCYPDRVERVLEKVVVKGFTLWVHALTYICSAGFEPSLSAESELKLIVMTLVKVIERVIGCSENSDSGVLKNSFVALMVLLPRLKGVQEKEENMDDEAECDTYEDDPHEETEDDDQDSEDDELEETEEEFMERYAMEALNLESTMVVEEEDFEDTEEFELGVLDELDYESVVLSLIERYHQVLINGQTFSHQLVTGLLSVFPQYSLFFKQL